MNDTIDAAHIESAIDLYELRLSWLHDADTQANAIDSVEARIRMHLYHIANTPELMPAPDEEPTDEAECFVRLATQICVMQPEENAAGYELAYEWLTQGDGKAAAAEAALSMYPASENTGLFQLFREHSELHPTLFRLYRKQRQVVPELLIKNAMTAVDATLTLKIEALKYAAAQPGLGLELFRSHYLPLLSGEPIDEVQLLILSLWGGLVRGDADATRALGIAINQASDAQALAFLLRLAALSGSPEFLPHLLQLAATEPDKGYYLLGLYGQKSVIPEMIKAMEDVHTLEHAAIAFSQLSGQILPRVPRLSVVGSDPQKSAQTSEEEADRIPDIQTARTWWQAHQATWQPNERWLMGKPATPLHLKTMCKKYAGSIGQDIMDLLALTQKAPLNIPSEMWHARQMQLLDAQAVAPVGAQATTRTATSAASARRA